MSTFPARLSSLLGFLKLVVAYEEGARRKKFSRECNKFSLVRNKFSLVRNKWYQSIPGSSWDHVSILKALVTGWRR